MTITADPSDIEGRDTSGAVWGELRAFVSGCPIDRGAPGLDSLLGGQDPSSILATVGGGRYIPRRERFHC
jgi:hypothetical protein